MLHYNFFRSGFFKAPNCFQKNKKIKSFVEFKAIVPPQNNISVIIYLCSCCSKPVCIYEMHNHIHILNSSSFSFFLPTQRKSMGSSAVLVPTDFHYMDKNS